MPPGNSGWPCLGPAEIAAYSVLPRNATLAGPRVSPSGPTTTGRPSAITCGAAPGTMRRIRPLLLMTGAAPGGGGPAGGWKPAGGVPDSATYSAPSGPQVKPRG